jgi:hypothetical protein
LKNPCHDHQFNSGDKINKELWKAAILLEPEEHLPLEPVLELLPPHHGLDDPFDRPLRILLLGEVLEDGVQRHLRPDGETLLELLLNPGDGLLVLLGGEALRAGQVAGHGGGEGRHLQANG